MGLDVRLRIKGFFFVVVLSRGFHLFLQDLSPRTVELTLRAREFYLGLWESCVVYHDLHRLDIQFGGAIARGAESFFWVDMTWM